MSDFSRYYAEIPCAEGKEFFSFARIRGFARNIEVARTTGVCTRMLAFVDNQ